MPVSGRTRTTRRLLRTRRDNRTSVITLHFPLSSCFERAGLLSFLASTGDLGAIRGNFIIPHEAPPCMAFEAWRRGIKISGIEVGISIAPSLGKKPGHGCRCSHCTYLSSLEISFVPGAGLDNLCGREVLYSSVGSDVTYRRPGQGEREGRAELPAGIAGLFWGLS